MSDTWIIILCIALGCAVLVLPAAYLAARRTFYSNPKKRGRPDVMPSGAQYSPLRDQVREMVKNLQAIPCEWAEITSDDGLKLRARYYHVREGAPVAICVHGYRANAIRDFCGGVVFCRDEGMNVLLIDQRGQGESEGKWMTFGIRERYDLKKWIEYIIQRCGKDTQVMLYGISMGGATVLMSAGLNLPENVRGILADCPFSSPKDIIKKVCGDMHLPANIVYPLIRLGARLYAGFDPDKATAAEAVKGAKMPVAIIHGEDDRFVPCAMGREIADANPEYVRFYPFPEAGHGISYMQDKARYRAIIRDFTKEAVGGK